MSQTAYEIKIMLPLFLGAVFGGDSPLPPLIFSSIDAIRVLPLSPRPSADTYAKLKNTQGKGDIGKTKRHPKEKIKVVAGQ